MRTAHPAQLAAFARDSSRAGVCAAGSSRRDSWRGADAACADAGNRCSIHKVRPGAQAGSSAQTAGCSQGTSPGAPGGGCAGNASRARSSQVAGQRKARPGHGHLGQPGPAHRRRQLQPGADSDRTCPPPPAQRWKDSTPTSESLASYGPGPARDVLSQLLQGSGYNVVLIGDQGQGTPREIVLSLRHAGACNDAAANPAPASEEDTDTEEQPQPGQPPVRPGMIHARNSSRLPANAATCQQQGTAAGATTW